MWGWWLKRLPRQCLYSRRWLSLRWFNRWTCSQSRLPRLSQRLRRSRAGIL